MTLFYFSVTLCKSEQSLQGMDLLKKKKEKDEKDTGKLLKNSPKKKSSLSSLLEDDLINYWKKFHKIKNKLQDNLKEDTKQGSSSNKTLTPADKTSNMLLIR